MEIEPHSQDCQCPCIPGIYSALYTKYYLRVDLKGVLQLDYMPSLEKKFIQCADILKEEGPKLHGVVTHVQQTLLAILDPFWRVGHTVFMNMCTV